MATTVQQLADQSLLSIIVAGSESSLEADEMTDYIFSLNRWMSSLVVMGINLGYTPVSSPSDVLTVPDGAIDGMISNMAIKLAPQYGGVVSPELRQDAKDGLNVLRNLGLSIRNTAYPSTLPIGSGNTWVNGYDYYGGNFP